MDKKVIRDIQCLREENCHYYREIILSIENPNVSTRKLMNSVHTHTMEYSSPFKNKILQLLTQMDLEIIVFSELSQTEKVKYCILSLDIRNLNLVQMDENNDIKKDSHI